MTVHLKYRQQALIMINSLKKLKATNLWSQENQFRWLIQFKWSTLKNQNSKKQRKKLLMTKFQIGKINLHSLLQDSELSYKMMMEQDMQVQFIQGQKKNQQKYYLILDLIILLSQVIYVQILNQVNKNKMSLSLMQQAYLMNYLEKI